MSILSRVILINFIDVFIQTNPMNSLRESLEAEILFWRDLVKTSRSSIHPDECKRMEHAMLFAQMKLLRIEAEIEYTEFANDPPGKH